MSHLPAPRRPANAARCPVLGRSPRGMAGRRLAGGDRAAQAGGGRAARCAQHPLHAGRPVHAGRQPGARGHPLREGAGAGGRPGRPVLGTRRPAAARRAARGHTPREALCRDAAVVQGAAAPPPWPQGRNAVAGDAAERHARRVHAHRRVLRDRGARARRVALDAASDVIGVVLFGRVRWAFEPAGETPLPALVAHEGSVLVAPPAAQIDDVIRIEAEGPVELLRFGSLAAPQLREAIARSLKPAPGIRSTAPLATRLAPSQAGSSKADPRGPRAASGRCSIPRPSRCTPAARPTSGSASMNCGSASIRAIPSWGWRALASRRCAAGCSSCRRPA